jgi:hypothetical protein
MTEIQPTTGAAPRKLTLVALGLNVFASAGLWSIVFTVNTNASLYRAVLVLPIGIVLGIVGICLAAVTGRSRGINRALGILGGLVLLSPLVGFLLRELLIR